MMPVSQPAPPIVLLSTDREILERWVREHHTPQRLALRARTILLAAEGVSNSEIAEELGVSRPTVLDWRKRFVEDGVNALIEIRPGRGRKAEITFISLSCFEHSTQVACPSQMGNFFTGSLRFQHGLFIDLDQIYACAWEEAFVLR